MLLKLKQALSMTITAGLLLLAASASAQLSRPTRPQVPLPDGPLRTVILKSCVSCHGIDDYAFHALTRTRWDSLLQEVHQELPMKPMASADHELLLDFLSENFGEDYSPFPRSYFPPEIDSFYNDEDGRQVLDIVCTECHELDRVYETRATIERWRVLLLEMRARGAGMNSDSDMERMAEWLSRVQSANTFE
jgi:hypothetical protein